MPRYSYSRLKEREIRILVLLPGRKADQLVGHLTRTSLTPPTEIPDFEALSYTWGSQENPESFIVIDENTGENLGIISMGQNLAAALRHLRSSHEPRTLWCDSLCINQEDLAERAAQVLRMGDIYRHTTQVLAWLGESSAVDGSDTAMHLLNEIGNAVHMDWQEECMSVLEPDEESSSFVHEMHRLITGGGIVSLTAVQWRALQKLFARPWFRRCATSLL